MPLVFASTFWGGVNYREQAEDLLGRTHTFVENAGWVQRPGVGTESPDAQNSDFDPQGLRKRLGSTEWQDLTGVLVASETLLGGFESEDTSGSAYVVAVGVKSMYTNQSGSFVQLNDSNSSAYTHSADVSKFTRIRVDSRDLIGLDGANKIQVYRGGADLDDELTSGNTWVETGTGTSRTITGTWDNGAYLLAAIRSRVVYSTGNGVLNPSPLAMASSSGIWDKTNAPRASFASGRVRLEATFVPEGGDDTNSIMYIGTDAGMEYFTGFGLPSDHAREITGAEPPLNHQAFFVTNNWLVYLTARGNILGVNGTRVIDLGARLKASDGTGPLDEIDLATSTTYSYGFWDADAHQGEIAISTSTSRINDLRIRLDFKLGEPVPGEQPPSFEQRVRLLPWRIASPDNNDGFRFLFQRTGEVVGVMGSGILYTLGSGNNDLDTIAIAWNHKTPIFSGGPWVSTLIKQIFGADLATIPTGDYPLTVNVYLDRETSASHSFEFDQASDDHFILDESELDVDSLGGAGIIKHFERVLRRAETFQIEFVNESVSETAVVATMSLPYEVGARVR